MKRNMILLGFMLILLLIYAVFGCYSQNGSVKHTGAKLIMNVPPRFNGGNYE